MGVSPPTQSIHILHVDDEPDLTEMAAEFLKRVDDRISVDIATRVNEGLDLLADNVYDCIISDYDMPGSNGIEFLESVREDYPTLPFILYTGKGSEEVASDAISAGVTDYLQKESGTDHYKVLANRVRNAVTASAAQTELDRTMSRINDAIYGLDTEWKFTFVSERAEELIQRTEDEVLGKSIWEEFAAAADSEIEEQYRTAMDTQEAVYFQDHYAPLDMWVQINAYPSESGLTVYFQNISKQKMGEKALHDERERFQALIEHSQDMITVFDQQGVIKFESPSSERVLGYRPDELVNESAFEYIHPDDQPGVAEWIAEFHGSAETVTGTYQYRFQHKDGSWVWLESIASSQVPPAVDGYVVNSRDITARKDSGPQPNIQ